MNKPVCRVCGSMFFAEPLLRYSNMPKAAQFMPDAQTLKDDQGADLEVCQCSGCGLVQLSNEPVPYYKEVIRAAAFSEEMKQFRMHQFEAFISTHGLNGKKLIEVGCGRGDYLSLVQHFDIDAYGLEYADESVMYCNEKGLKVSRGFIHDHNDAIHHAPFDAFFILNFLEHLPDPKATLKGIAHNLKDGAAGLVEVPNFDMILRNNLFSEFIGDHLCYFTRETFVMALTMSGFQVLECKEIWHDYILCATVVKRPQQDLSNFARIQQGLKDEIHGYINKFNPGKVAIWGAGHQALAIIAMLQLSDKISYVVDSATFKQGKYTPATHIPIVAPQTLNADPVEAVIVMAASYSDEVGRILRRQYDPKLNIAILRDSGLEYI